MTVSTRTLAISTAMVLVCGVTVGATVPTTASAAPTTCTRTNPVQVAKVPIVEAARSAALLNNKASKSGTNFVNHLSNMIKGAPCGSQIDISVFNLGPDNAANRKISGALIHAVDSGVIVRVIFDKKNFQARSPGGKGFVEAQAHVVTKEITKVDKALAKAQKGKTDPVKVKSQFWLCSSCIAHHKGPDHNKFATFSQIGNSVNIVFQTTANFQHNGSGDADWNSGLVVTDGTTSPPVLYDAYTTYFGDLVKYGTSKKNSSPDYFHDRPAATKAFDTATSTSLLNAPEKLVNGTSNANDDFVIQTLGQAQSNCSTGSDVYVVDSGWQAPRALAIIDELNDLEVAGCNVTVIAGGQDTNDYPAFHRLVYYSASDNPTGTTTKNPRHMDAYYLCAPDKHPKGTHYANSHNKYWLLSNDNGSATVFDGSENFAAQSLNDADQAVIELHKQAAYDAFKKQVNQMISPAKVNTLSKTGLFHLAPSDKIWGAGHKSKLSPGATALAKDRKAANKTLNKYDCHNTLAS